MPTYFIHLENALKRANGKFYLIILKLYSKTNIV